MGVPAARVLNPIGLLLLTYVAILLTQPVRCSIECRATLSNFEIGITSFTLASLREHDAKANYGVLELEARIFADLKDEKKWSVRKTDEENKSVKKIDQTKWSILFQTEHPDQTIRIPLSLDNDAALEEFCCKSQRVAVGTMVKSLIGKDPSGQLAYLSFEFPHSRKHTPVSELQNSFKETVLASVVSKLAKPDGENVVGMSGAELFALPPNSIIRAGSHFATHTYRVYWSYKPGQLTQYVDVTTKVALTKAQLKSEIEKKLVGKHWTINLSRAVQNLSSPQVGGLVSEMFLKMEGAAWQDEDIVHYGTIIVAEVTKSVDVLGTTDLASWVISKIESNLKIDYWHTDEGLRQEIVEKVLSSFENSQYSKQKGYLDANDLPETVRENEHPTILMKVGS